jgi:glycosyltransferase involved in cell wall biosynthesis
MNPVHTASQPTVSIILATFNRASLLPKAIESVLQQTLTDFEFLIIDDGSTDNTAEVVARYTDPRIVYRLVEHGERSRARNMGIRLSRGRYIAFLDSDDWYLPNKLEEQVAALETHPECGMTLGGWAIVDHTGKTILEMHRWEYYQSRLLSVEDWLFHSSATPITILARREWFECMGGFDPTLSMAEDTELWMRLALGGCLITWTRSNVAIVLAHESNSLRDWPKVRAGRMAFLHRIFENPAVGIALKMSQDEVYARFHLGLSWLAFDSGLIPEGAGELERAVERFPGLLKDDGRSIAESIVDYSQYFLIQDPLRYAVRVFDHLPASLSNFQKRRRSTIRDICTSRAWKAKHEGNYREMRENTLLAIYNDPGCIKNRGILSMTIQSILGQRFWQVIHPENAPVRV